MRKLAINSYHNYHHSNSVPLLPNKQQIITTTGDLQQNMTSSSPFNSCNHINDENQISSTTRKKYLWNRSASKDG